jgi:hypothetical protein
MGSVTRFLNKTQPHTWVMGEKQSAQFDFAGQATGAHDHLYKPANVQPIPTSDTDSAALVERDRMRRVAKRAAGLDSTIRTSPAGATLYNPQPKALLGS